MSEIPEHDRSAAALLSHAGEYSGGVQAVRVFRNNMATRRGGDTRKTSQGEKTLIKCRKPAQFSTFDSDNMRHVSRTPVLEFRFFCGTCRYIERSCAMIRCGPTILCPWSSRTVFPSRAMARRSDSRKDSQILHPESFPTPA